MLKAVVLLSVFVSSISLAQEAGRKVNDLFILENGQLVQVTKAEAIIHLAQGKKEPVLKCTEQILSDKATLKVRK